jgi:hypothetical protein
MKKLLGVLLTAVLSAGCGIDYDGTTKLIFEGHVTDANGQPLKGIKVITVVSNSDYSDDIGYDHTDVNGHYLMIFPKADEKVNVAVQINAGEGSRFSRTEIYSIDLEEIQDYKIDFGVQALYEFGNSVHLRIIFPNILPEKVNLDGLVSDKRTDHNFDILPIESEWWQDEADYIVAPNQVLRLKYLLSNGTVHEVQIPVGNEDLTYTVQ